jgi:hypothetical protein
LPGPSAGSVPSTAQEPVSFTYAGLESAPETYGHRFLSPGPHPVTSPEITSGSWRSNYVHGGPGRAPGEDPLSRLPAAARALGGKVLVEEDLLTEVNYLVEYPLAVTGSFSRLPAAAPGGPDHHHAEPPALFPRPGKGEPGTAALTLSPLPTGWKGLQRKRPEGQ